MWLACVWIDYESKKSEKRRRKNETEDKNRAYSYFFRNIQQKRATESKSYIDSQSKKNVLYHIQHEPMQSPSEILASAKRNMRDNGFEPNKLILPYPKHCFYSKGKNFRYIEKTLRTSGFKLRCTIKDCPHKNKPRCEMKKNFDWEYFDERL
jgi:hypothetical protein